MHLSVRRRHAPFGFGVACRRQSCVATQRDAHRPRWPRVFCRRKRGDMQRRFWAPVVAVMIAILVLVPTTLAKGSAGDTYGVAFGANRFPAGLNTAVVN